MDEKKSSLSKRAAAAAVANKNEKPKKDSYFKGVLTEMKKVVWPTKKQLFSYTLIVLVTCIVFALLFWGFDEGFLALLKLVFNITL